MVKNTSVKQKQTLLTHSLLTCLLLFSPSPPISYALTVLPLPLCLSCRTASGCPQRATTSGSSWRIEERTSKYK